MKKPVQLSERRAVKDRQRKKCEATITTTAKGLREHARECKGK